MCVICSELDVVWINNIYKQNGIYCIRNKITGATYIGKTTVSFGDRWDCHKAMLNGGYHYAKDLQKDWNKYGKENFEFIVLKQLENDDDINELEKMYIAESKKTGLSYNSADGGDDCYWKGRHLSEEARRSISEKNRANMLGHKDSEDTRKHKRDARLKYFEQMTDAERQAYHNWMVTLGAKNKGNKWSSEAKENFARLQAEHPNGAKYTADQIRDMRNRYINGESIDDIAVAFGTTSAYVKAIIQRRRWANI